MAEFHHPEPPGPHPPRPKSRKITRNPLQNAWEGQAQPRIEDESGC